VTAPALVLGVALAAPAFVTRPMTLPRHDFAGDVGIGYGHRPDFGGGGLNLEGAFGVTEHVELGLRTGVRFSDESRFAAADYYARTLWTETYGTNYAGVAANPEFRVRWVAYQGDVVELGLDGRAYLPFEPRSRFGGMFGLPLAFHIGDSARIDTGPYFVTLFYAQTGTALSFPAYFWFQVSEKVWLGPMARVLVPLTPNPHPDPALLLGFGVGIQVASAVDLKSMILFPGITETQGAQNFGVGFGVQFRIE